FRLFTGAIHAIFLMKNGVTIQDIALLQIVFSITSLLFLYPIGIIADYYGPKKLTVLSCLLMSLYYVLSGMYTDNFNVLILAHIIQSISLASIIGASSWILNSLTKEGLNKGNYVNDLGYLENEIQAIGGILASIIGILLTYIFDIKGYMFAYLLASIMLFLNAINFLNIPECRIDTVRKKVTDDVKNIFLKSMKEPCIFWYIISFGSIIAIYQSLFHFWQPLIRTCSDLELDEVISAAICFISSGIVKYNMNKYVRSKKFLKIDPFVILKLSIYITIIGFVALYIAELKFYIIVVILSSLHGLLSIISKIVNSQFLKIAPINQCSAILSIVLLLSLAIINCSGRLPCAPSALRSPAAESIFKYKLSFFVKLSIRP
ncbi:MAG: MFS transporter, partial [Pedobacter sp.]